MPGLNICGRSVNLFLSTKPIKNVAMIAWLPKEALVQEAVVVFVPFEVRAKVAIKFTQSSVAVAFVVAGVVSIFVNELVQVGFVGGVPTALQPCGPTTAIANSLGLTVAGVVPVDNVLAEEAVVFVAVWSSCGFNQPVSLSNSSNPTDVGALPVGATVTLLDSPGRAILYHRYVAPFAIAEADSVQPEELILAVKSEVTIQINKLPGLIGLR